MDLVDQQSSAKLRRDKRRVLAVVASCGFIGALLVFSAAANLDQISGTFGFLIVGALAFNLVAWLARRLLTTVGKRIFVVGRFPVALGLAKLSGFAAVTLLILFCLGGFIVGGQLRIVSLRALVLGVLCFAILSFVSNGLLNGTVLFRKYRGTLETTSGDAVRRHRH